MTIIWDHDDPPPRAEILAALIRHGTTAEIHLRVWAEVAGLHHMRDALNLRAPHLLPEAVRTWRAHNGLAGKE